MICSANQLTGFYMMATLAFNELRWTFWKKALAAIIKSSTLDILQDSEYAFAEAQSKFLSSYLKPETRTLSTEINFRTEIPYKYG